MASAQDKAEIVRDRERAAWELRLQGWTQERIAEELGISQPTVCKILRRVESRLAEEFREHAEEVKARQAAILERIAAEALRQWERSCQDAVRVTVETGRAKATEMGLIHLPDKEVTTTEGQSGNPALLAQAREALADIRAIWGMDAPKRQEHTGAGGGPIAISEVVIELPAEESE